MQGEAGWFLQCPGLHGSARQNPAEDTRFPPLSARGLSSKALPGGIVCELATDRRPRGAAPPQETRHASDRANSRPPLAPSQQPPPATSSPPPLWPRPPRRAPKSPAPRRRPLGPQRWRRGWDRTDVAHAWWRH